MVQFGGIQQHSIMLQIILFLYFVQSWSMVQIFGETFNMYAHHLLQYRLVCVIKFVLQWSNHWCHFISKACMYAGHFDLTPQQHC